VWVSRSKTLRDRHVEEVERNSTARQPAVGDQSVHLSQSSAASRSKRVPGIDVRLGQQCFVGNAAEARRRVTRIVPAEVGMVEGVDEINSELKFASAFSAKRQRKILLNGKIKELLHWSAQVHRARGASQ